jgi:hypothetical protein
MHLPFLQILLGALVAGIDAGRAFPTWPDERRILPPNALRPDGGPVWRNFFENEGMVQFIHRMSGYLLFAFGIVVWLRGRKSPHPATRRAFDWLAVMLFGQMVLGIVTVLTSAHVHVAITHQVGAVILWVLILRAATWPNTPLHHDRGGHRMSYACRPDGLPARDRGAGAGRRPPGLGPGNHDARGAAAQRAEEMAALEGVLHARRTDPRVGRLAGIGGSGR